MGYWSQPNGMLGFKASKGKLLAGMWHLFLPQTICLFMKMVTQL